MFSSPIAKTLLPQPPLGGIQYGSLVFTEPRAFPPIWMAPFQGIYAIVIPHSGFSPRPFKLLYIGESSDFNKRLTLQHEKLGSWKLEAGSAQLHFAYVSMPFWTEEQRKNAEAELISRYNPPCNVQMLSPIAWGLKRKL